MKTYVVNEIFYSLQGEGVRAGTANLFLRFSGCNETCRVETHGFDCDTEFTSGRKLTLDEIVAELKETRAAGMEPPRATANTVVHQPEAPAAIRPPRGAAATLGEAADTARPAWAPAATLPRAAATGQQASPAAAPALSTQHAAPSAQHPAPRAEHPAPNWIVLTGGEPGLQVDRELIDRLHQEGFRLAIETNGSIALPDGIDWITVSPKVAEHAIRQRVANEVKYVRGYGQAIPRTVVEAEYKLISPAFAGDQVDPRALAWCIELVRQHADWRLSVQQHKFWRIR